MFLIFFNITNKSYIFNIKSFSMNQNDSRKNLLITSGIIDAYKCKIRYKLYKIKYRRNKEIM